MQWKLDETQSSYARWRLTPAARPGDLFSDVEWCQGQAPPCDPDALTRNLYLYIVFEKGDTDPSVIGTGLLVDDVSVGRKATELLAQHTYDVNACAAGTSDIGGEACLEAAEPNRYLGNLTQLKSYQDGRLLAEKTIVYSGLNGRASGERQRIDWEGNGSASMLDFVTRQAYEGHGLRDLWVAPYQPGVDDGRRYAYHFARGVLDGLEEEAAGGAMFLRPNNGSVQYNPAGGLSGLYFINGASTQIVPDALNRPSSITANGPSQTLWQSGAYGYDGAGNITSIGNQEFAYDKVMRLKEAQVLSQAKDPAQTDPWEVTYSYDAFGNMTDRDWESAGITAGAPTALEFFNRDHVGTGSISDNRIHDPGFAYDLNGNLTRMIEDGASKGMTWDARNRMSTFYDGDPATTAAGIAERYLYDASGFRVVRFPEASDGRPMISLRDGGGQLLAEFTEDPAAGAPELQKDFLYAAGQLAVERRVIENVPELHANSILEQNGDYGFTLTSGGGFSTYTIDVRTHSGIVGQVSGLTPDGNGVIWVAESNFSTAETNFIRIRGDSSEPEPYSAPVTLAIDPGVSGSSPNQIRAIRVTRSGTDLHVRWDLLNTNGQTTYLYFERSDGGGLALLTPFGIPAGTLEYTVPDQALSSPCGYFRSGITSLAPDDSGGVENTPASGGATNLEPNEPGCDEDPPPGSPSTYTFANAFHHRDHLGSLRVVTDDGGSAISAHDFYPFGMEMVSAAESTAGGSRKRYTGHERDDGTDLDYMLARYYGSSLSRFLSVDPVGGGPASPQSWNAYPYVQNNPLKYSDPSGMTAQCGGDAAQCVADVKNTVPAADRGAVQISRIEGQGSDLTVTFDKDAAAGHQSGSGNFQAFQTIATSDQTVSIDTSQTSFARVDSDGSVVTESFFGSTTSGEGSFGATLPAGESSTEPGVTQIFVSGILGPEDRASTTAHEVRHGARIVTGQPYKDELTMTEVKPGHYLVTRDPNGAVNRETRAAEEEARRNYHDR